MIVLMKALRVHTYREIERMHGRKIVKSVAYWTFLFLSVSLLLKLSPPISRLFVFYSGICMVILLFGWWWTFNRFFIGAKARDVLQKKTLVVGWRPACQKLLDSMRSHSGLRIVGYLPVGFAEAQDVCPPAEITRYDWGLDGIDALLDEIHFDAVILGDPDLPNNQVMRLYEVSARHMAEFMVLPSYSRVMLSTLQIETHGGIPILAQICPPLKHPFNQGLKRLMDIAGAIVGLLISAPLIAVFGWFVYRESPGPIFYRQRRTGINGKPFEVIKIRSMRLDAEQESGARWAVADDPRRLEIGAFMRKWNIDELPQFWNILKGEMSLVGPRPERPELIEDFKYSIEYYNLRHTVMPGLTGWAAVNGWRGDTCLQTRIEHDLDYIERWNLWLDFSIIFRTFCSNKNAY